MLGSVMLRKSDAFGIMFRSQVLNWVSTPYPVMYLVLVGIADVVPHYVHLVPVKITPSVLVPPPLGSLHVLASMLYWVPFWNDVLLYQVFPPEEWLA